MGAFRCAWILAIIPATMLLAVSFFVLFTARKSESRGLQVFGYVVSALLWLAAAIVMFTGVYAAVNPQGCMPGGAKRGCGISGSMGMRGPQGMGMQTERMQKMEQMQKMMPEGSAVK